MTDYKKAALHAAMSAGLLIQPAQAQPPAGNPNQTVFAGLELEELPENAKKREGRTRGECPEYKGQTTEPCRQPGIAEVKEPLLLRIKNALLNPRSAKHVLEGAGSLPDVVLPAGPLLRRGTRELFEHGKRKNDLKDAREIVDAAAAKTGALAKSAVGTDPFSGAYDALKDNDLRILANAVFQADRLDEKGARRALESLGRLEAIAALQEERLNSKMREAEVALHKAAGVPLPEAPAKAQSAESAAPFPRHQPSKLKTAWLAAARFVYGDKDLPFTSPASESSQGEILEKLHAYSSNSMKRYAEVAGRAQTPEARKEYIERVFSDDKSHPDDRIVAGRMLDQFRTNINGRFSEISKRQFNVEHEHSDAADIAFANAMTRTFEMQKEIDKAMQGIRPGINEPGADARGPKLLEEAEARRQKLVEQRGATPHRQPQQR